MIDMKKVFNYIFISVLFFFCMITCVYAEETCTATELNNLRKSVESIVGTYEFVYDESNTIKGFNYVIYNIPDDIIVSFVNDINNTVDNLEVVNGIAMVFDDNLYDTYDVSFTFRSLSSPCDGAVKNIKIRKPRYNYISEKNECKRYEVQDYIYCQEWVDIDFPLSDNQIIQRINEKKEREKAKEKTKCINCEENEKNTKLYNTIMMVRKYAIYGLIVGIVIDLIVILILLKKAQETFV